MVTRGEGEYLGSAVENSYGRRLAPEGGISETVLEKKQQIKMSSAVSKDIHR